MVKHFNKGKKLFLLGFFAPRLTEFNLIAAKKAKAAIAYGVAANCLNIALELLSPFEWQEYYDLKTNVYLEASEIQYLETNFTLAHQLADVVLIRAKTVLIKARAYRIKIHAYIAQNQMQLAIDEGFNILELLEISFDRDSNYVENRIESV